MFRISGPRPRPFLSRRQTMPARQARRPATSGVSRPQAATHLDRIPPPHAWHRPANSLKVWNIWQCGPRDTRCKRPAGMLPSPRTSGRLPGISPARRSQDLINRRRAPHVRGEYDVISIESEDMDMSIRGKSILTTLAIALIGTAPAWSQSLLKTLDPDNDGTVDLAEAKSAASKLFDKLDRDHDGTIDKRELRGRLNAKDFAAADPDHDGTLDKNEFLALVEKRFNAANPDNDGTIDAKELKSSAGRSLVLLLK